MATRDPASEAAVREIVATGRATRTPLPRALWIAALVTAAVCLGALAIGWLTGGDAPPSATTSDVASSGIGTGIAIGVVAGVVIGVVIGRRARP